VKINEVIAEGISNWLANKAGQRVQKIQQDPALAAKHGLTYIDPASPPAPEPIAPAPTTPEQSRFLKQFEIIDDDPITVQWKTQQFQRKDGHGEWVNFPAGKPVPQQMIAALDKISPPLAPAAAPTQIKGAQVGSKVPDRFGAIWVKGKDGKWSNPEQGIVTDPGSIDKLEKRSNTLWNKA
jgi:hypothetical protein